MTGELIPIPALTTRDRDHMRALLNAHFHGVTSEQFQRDLEDKTAAVLLRDAAGALRGFSTLAAYRSRCTPQPLGVVCSGDTIVDPAARTSFALARTWIASARHLADELNCSRTVWLLIVSGFRTYRFLPVFFRVYLPRPASGDGCADEADRDLLRALATERYGRSFDPETGIVRLAAPQPLRAEAGLAAELTQRAADPDVAFFLRANPGHARGDELACLCDLGETNLTPAGRRMTSSPLEIAPRRTSREPELRAKATG